MIYIDAYKFKKNKYKIIYAYQEQLLLNVQLSVQKKIVYIPVHDIL